MVRNLNKDRTGTKIYVLDDDELMVLSVVDYFYKKGYCCDGTTSIGEAVIQANDNIDIFIIDYLMPKTNGDKIADTIKKINEDILIIMLTGYSGVLNFENAIRDTAIDFYVEKSDNFEELYKTVLQAEKASKKIKDLRSKMKVEGFGNRLKAIRQLNNDTQEQLAEKLKITRSNIANYELGRNSPTMDFLVKISRLYNVSCDYLLGK